MCVSWFVCSIYLTLSLSVCVSLSVSVSMLDFVFSFCVCVGASCWCSCFGVLLVLVLARMPVVGVSVLILPTSLLRSTPRVRRTMPDSRVLRVISSNALKVEVGYNGSHALLHGAVVVLCWCADQQGRRQTRQQCFGTRLQRDCFLEDGARSPPRRIGPLHRRFWVPVARGYFRPGSMSPHNKSFKCQCPHVVLHFDMSFNTKRAYNIAFASALKAREMHTFTTHTQFARKHTHACERMTP